MKHWFGPERRLRDAVLGAMIPAHGGRPGLGDRSMDAFWTTFAAAAPPLLRIGLRAAVWAVGLRALLGGRPFRWRDAAGRQAVLAALDGSRWYLVRQLANTLKVVACFAYGADPALRVAWDRPKS